MVLPFMNMSGDPANEYFSDGISEELTVALSRVPGLRVVGHTSAFSFKGKDAPVDSIGRALRVGYVLEGSVRATGDRVRIVAQLIDAASGFHVWSDIWDRQLRDVFAVQAEISDAVVQALHPRFTEAVDRSDEPRPETTSAQAHADVLRGYQALFRGERDDYFVAERLFDNALRLDPDYARAHAGLAVVYTAQAYRGWVPRNEGWVRATAAAERALQLDPQLPAAHSAMGRLMERQWDFAAADLHFRRAIELAPGSETWYRHRAMLLAILGRGEEAIALAKRAVDIDPLATGAHRQLGYVSFQARQYENAIAAHANALALAPEHVYALQYLAQAESMLDRHAEAVSTIRRALARGQHEPILIATAGWIHARAGDATSARAWIREIESESLPSPYLLAMVHAGLGETERAFQLLDKALAERDPFLVEVGVFPAFDAMRTDLRMDRLLRSIGLVT